MPWYDPKKCGTAEPIPGRCGVKLWGRDAYCKNNPLEGKRRCRLHRTKEGGQELRAKGKDSEKGRPLGTKNKAPKIKDSLYANTFLPGEEERYAEAETGTLSDEIKIAKLQLNRLLEAQSVFKMAAEDPDNYNDDGSVSFTLTFPGENKINPFTFEIEPGEPYVKRIRRKADYTSDIQKALEVIAKLESKHDVILKNKPLEKTNRPLEKLVEAITSLRGNADEAKKE